MVDTTWGMELPRAHHWVTITTCTRNHQVISSHFQSITRRSTVLLQLINLAWIVSSTRPNRTQPSTTPTIRRLSSLCPIATSLNMATMRPARKTNSKCRVRLMLPATQGKLFFVICLLLTTFKGRVTLEVGWIGKTPLSSMATRRGEVAPQALAISSPPSSRSMDWSVPATTATTTWCRLLQAQLEMVSMLVSQTRQPLWKLDRRQARVWLLNLTSLDQTHSNLATLVTPSNSTRDARFSTSGPCQNKSQALQSSIRTQASCRRIALLVVSGKRTQPLTNSLKQWLKTSRLWPPHPCRLLANLPASLPRLYLSLIKRTIASVSLQQLTKTMVRCRSLAQLSPPLDTQTRPIMSWHIQGLSPSLMVPSTKWWKKMHKSVTLMTWAAWLQWQT